MNILQGAERGDNLYYFGYGYYPVLDIVEIFDGVENIKTIMISVNGKKRYFDFNGYEVDPIDGAPISKEPVLFWDEFKFKIPKRPKYKIDKLIEKYRQNIPEKEFKVGDIVIDVVENQIGRVELVYPDDDIIAVHYFRKNKEFYLVYDKKGYSNNRRVLFKEDDVKEIERRIK